MLRLSNVDHRSVRYAGVLSVRLVGRLGVGIVGEYVVQQRGEERFGYLGFVADSSIEQSLTQAYSRGRFMVDL